jgi:D-amino peptidase
LTRTRAKTAKAVLDFFLGHTNGPAHWERALRALTLFMVRGHAPGFYAQHKLDRVFTTAVRRLDGIPRDLPAGLAAIDAMSRLDASWVEWAEGKKPALPAAEEARAFLAAVRERDGLLWAWVMSELAVQLGLDCKLTLEKPRPLREVSADEDLYWVTHLVLLETRYFSRPVGKGAFSEEAKELALAVGPALAVKEFDLLGELAFCLQALGADFEPAMAFEPLVTVKGQVGKETGYSGAHAAASALVALAGALDRSA